MLYNLLISLTVIATANAGPLPFKVGQDATCMYEAVKSYFDGTEFLETLPIICVILEAIRVDNEYDINYQHLKVDCTKDLDRKSSDKPGMGIVKNHPQNFKIRWYNSTNCYHLTERH